jgi:hypothetical protein
VLLPQPCFGRRGGGRQGLDILKLELNKHRHLAKVLLMVIIYY